MLRLRDILSTSASTLVSGGLGLALAVLAARLLGPEQNGHYAQYVVILNLVCLALNLGVGPATTYFVASERALPEHIVRINRDFLVAMGGLALLVVALLGFAGGHQWLEQTLRVPATVAAIGALGGVALLALNQATALRMGLHEYSRANLLNMLRTGAPLPFVAVACLLVPDSRAAAAAQTVVIACVAVYAWARIGAARINTPLPAGSLRSLLSYGSLAYFSNLLHYVAIRGLLLGLSFFATPAAVGFANLALLLLEALLLVPSAIGQLLFPQSSDEAFNARAMESVLRLALVIALVAALVMALVAPAVSTAILGERYLEVGVALRHLAPSFVLMTVPRILSPVLAGRGKPQLPLIGAALSVAAGTPLALWLMPQQGLLGTMWVINAVSLCTAVVMLRGYMNESGSGWLSVLVPRRSEILQWWLALRRFARHTA